MYEMRNLCPGPEGGERGRGKKKAASHRSNCLELVSLQSETAGKKKRQSHQICLFVCLLASTFTEKSGFFDFLGSQ